MWLPLLIIFLVVAVAFYSVLIPLAALVAVGATIYYFATLDWATDAKEGAFALVLLVVAAAIIAAAYSYFGIAGVVLAVILILAFVGMTS